MRRETCGVCGGDVRWHPDMHCGVRLDRIGRQWSIGVVRCEQCAPAPGESARFGAFDYIPSDILLAERVLRDQ